MNDLTKKYENIPEDLKREKRWCLYKIIQREGKNTKLPLMPNGKPAKSNDKSTWYSYDDCIKALKQNVGEGLGFFLGDGYIGIDIDKVSDEIMEYMMDKNAKSMTADFLREISTYAEFSPSGTGLHLIGKGKVPGERKRHNNLEIYDENRFFTVTGNIIKDKDRSEISDINKELLPLYQKYMLSIENRENDKQAGIKRDRIFSLRNASGDALELLFERGYFHYTGEDLRQIYYGNYESYFNSRSEADFFMLQRLLYYTGNVETAISLMENSGLKREKWYKRRAKTDYIHYVADKAINSMNKFYDWSREKKYGNRNENSLDAVKISKEDKNDMIRRYDVHELKYILDFLKKELKSNVSKYEEYLRASGNNYKYPYIHQLSIYNMNKTATACAEYDYWKSIGRVVKRNEKGIPLLDEKTGKIKYIFDVSQTVSRDHNISEVKLWEYDSRKHIVILDKLINSFKQKDASLIFSLDEKIDALANLYAKQYLYKGTDELSEEFLKENSKLDILNFLKESVKVSMCARMRIEYKANTQHFSALSNSLRQQDLDKLLIYTSTISKQALTHIGNEIFAFQRQEEIEKISKKEQTKNNEGRYNISNKESENKLEKEIGGFENGRKSDTVRQGVYSEGQDILSRSQGEQLRGNGGSIHYGEDVRGRRNPDSDDKNAGNGRREQTEPIWQGKTQVSQRTERSGLSNDVTGRNTGETSDRYSRQGGRFSEHGRTEDEREHGNDHTDAGSRLSEIRRSEEESRHDTDKNGNGTDNLGIENKSENTDDSSKDNIEKEKEAEQVSFSFGKNYVQGRFALPLQQKEIDTVLLYGGNEYNLKLGVIAEFTKDKTNEELADFLKDTFKGGNGFYLGEQKICAWYGNDGIHLSNDISARENPAQIISWKDVASRIEQLLDDGKYATNVELVEAIGNERTELAEKLWFLKGDLSDEVKQDFLQILNAKQIAGYPEKTEYLAKKLEDKEFRENLRVEYLTFLKEYRGNSDILRFHYHKLDEISKRLDDLELPRKEFTSTLIDLPAIQGFITEDEIDERLSRGSNVSDGKERIYNFFKQSHNLQEKANFLKDEYGTGGQSHALSGAGGSSEWHDAKGIKLEKENCKDIFLNWNQVAKRIDNLIENGRFTQEDVYIEQENIKTAKEYLDEESHYEEPHKEQNSKENDRDKQREQEILLIQDEREISYEEAEEIYEKQTEIEHNAFTSDIKNSVSQNQMQKDYWVVEFNEGSGLIEKDYAGEVVTKELLDEIRELDEKIRVHNKTVGEDEYGEMTDEWAGYSKFYFDHIVDGKSVENIRMDIGDGNEANQRDFEYIYEQIELSKESKEQKEEDIDNALKEILEKESMSVVSSKDDYVKLLPYFRNFVYADDSKFEEYSPFEDDENSSNLIRLTFFKNQDKEYRVVYNNADSLMYSSNVDYFLEKIEAEKVRLEDNTTEKTNEDKVAVKVGYYYAVVEKDKVKDISLEETGVRIYPKENNFEGKIYPLYRGSTFEESTKIDKLFDEIATSMKEVNLTDLNDVFYLENQGLYEISSDKVTEEKVGYDFEVASFNTQFPDYYNDIYVYNKNLKIDGTNQNIAYINRENEIQFNVNLPEEEKTKVLEIRDKKEILSTLIFKEIKEPGEYHFNPQNEEFILERKGVSEGQLSIPKHITDKIDGKEGYCIFRSKRTACTVKLSQSHGG